MDKINVVLIVHNNKLFEQTVRSLNLQNVNPVAIIVENAPGRFLQFNDKEIPLVPFSGIQAVIDADKNFIWLISGFVGGVGDIWTTKKFLMASGILEDNIVNFEILPHISVEWLANLRYVEKNGADFFATGISYTEVGLALKCLPLRGVNLAGSNQDLRQGYLTAKYVFEHVKPGTIKFVLIGLAPYSFRYDNAESFSVCSRNLQYLLALNDAPQTRHDFLLQALTADNVKNIFETVTAAQADLNFDHVKRANNSELTARALVNWETELDNLTKKLRPQTVQKNFQILKAYIKLCLDNGAKPVGVVFPFAPMMRKNYSEELLTLFRLAIRQLEESHDFACVDMFDLQLGYDCFYNMAHLNLKGATFASTFLSLRLLEKNILSPKNFCDMPYSYFEFLSNVIPKESYNAFIEDVFKNSAELIRAKDKIRVGFVLYDSSMWCGDDLYKLFARDKRFEPTIFLCLRTDRPDDELVEKDFWHGVEQFKSRGRNVVAVSDKNFSDSRQDVLIFLTPYLDVLPAAFQIPNITARTLMTYLPYGFQNSQWYYWLLEPLMYLSWKLFLETKSSVKLLREKCPKGASRVIYSGYPKLDAFFKKDAEIQFDWKVTRPDAKKIIWAPHWSINAGIFYATFQWNFKFMYEFAKAHPETSWGVKPHPNLLFSAVRSGLFPSAESFEKYLKAWDDLPNAKVYTGAYYQSLFATSDGMIHDSGSFIAEYQYVNKPMIFLTRDTQNFNKLVEEILQASYTVDGQDLKGIAAMIQKVIIDGDDFKAAERKKVFDNYLNYPKYNGMSASKYIYRSIADALKA